MSTLPSSPSESSQSSHSRRWCRCPNTCN